MTGCNLVNRHIRIYSNTSDLPGGWDCIAKEYFQNRAFLSHLETYNLCEQLYYLMYLESKLTAAAVQYHLRLNLFMYGNWELAVQMHVIGIPCSVAANGLLGEPSEFSYLIKQIFSGTACFLIMFKCTVTGTLRLLSHWSYPACDGAL
jgi:hypothetical protein